MVAKIHISNDRRICSIHWRKWLSVNPGKVSAEIQGVSGFLARIP